MVPTYLLLLLAAVGIMAAGKDNPRPNNKAPRKLDVVKNPSGLNKVVFQITLRPDQKPKPTAEFDTPQDCKGKFPEHYQTRNGKMIKVWCLADHSGHDFATLRVNSWAACAEVCSWRSECVAFSFEGETIKKGTNCWLKKMVQQTLSKSSYVWSGTVLKLDDVPADKRKGWRTHLAPRHPAPATEPYRPWFSTGMPKLSTYYPPQTTMVKKDRSRLKADTPGLGGEITLSDLAFETSGLITDGPKPTSRNLRPFLGVGNWAFAFDSSFISKLQSQIASMSTLLPSPSHPRHNNAPPTGTIPPSIASTSTLLASHPRHNNAPPTGTVPPSISTKSSLEVYPIRDTTSRVPVTTSTRVPPPPPPPPSPPPAVAVPTPVTPAVPEVPAQYTGVAPLPAAPGPWVVPKIQRSVLDCYKCGWEAPRAVLPRAIDFFCRGGQNESFGSLWKNDTVFSSGPLALMYWTKDIPLLRFLVTPHLNTSLHLRQPGLKERCVDNLSRAINECDQDSNNGTTRGGFVIDDMARWGIDPQPHTRVTECDWHPGNGTEDPWCTTWHKEPLAMRYDMVTVRCPLATAALSY